MGAEVKLTSHNVMMLKMTVLLMVLCDHKVSPRSTNDLQDPPTSVPQTASRCLEPKDRGTCDDWLLRWYFHEGDGACYFFGFSGCGGNGNKFETKEECEKQCGVADRCPLQPLCPDGCNLTKDERGCSRCKCPKEVAVEVCSAGQSRGLCRSLMHRFAYDPKKKTCREFIYGGCGGNENNFETAQECMDVCGQL